MVGVLLCLLLGTAEPYTLEYPDSVRLGETFTVTVTCSEPGCTGISSGSVNATDGLSFRGSFTSSRVSSVTTPTGRQLSQTVEYQINFTASAPGLQTIQSFTLDIGGYGPYTTEDISVMVTGSPPAREDRGGTGQDQPVWLEGELRDPGGRIYPGTRLTLDYYVFASVPVENVSYWWNAPELGVIRHVETIPDSNWESAGKGRNANRSRLAVVEMTPAAAGSLHAPFFSADITGTQYNLWGKQDEWTVESSPIILPVYPFPPDPPEGWDGTLLDSISITLDRLPCPPGQGGELSFRVTCQGPGHAYMEDPPEIHVSRPAIITPANQGRAGNKRWWDFILEPEETGTHILSPESAVWLDRGSGTYRTVPVEPCTLDVTVIPRQPGEIVLPEQGGGIPSRIRVLLVALALLLLTVALGIAAKRNDRRLGSVTSARDLDELLTGLENELSLLLSGKREYMGFEELDEFLDRCDTDNLLTRRILRFWKDLESSITEREITEPSFRKLKETAGELLEELKRDLEDKREEDQ